MKNGKWEKAKIIECRLAKGMCDYKYKDYDPK
jgi:hypothetical protein